MCIQFAGPGGYHHLDPYHYSDQPREPRGHYPGPSSGYEKTFAVGNRRSSEPYDVHKRELREREDYLQDSGGYTMDSAESDYQYERDMQVSACAREYVATTCRLYNRLDCVRGDHKKAGFSFSLCLHCACACGCAALLPVLPKWLLSCGRSPPPPPPHTHTLTS